MAGGAPRWGGRSDHLDDNLLTITDDVVDGLDHVPAPDGISLGHAMLTICATQGVARLNLSVTPHSVKTYITSAKGLRMQRETEMDAEVGGVDLKLIFRFCVAVGKLRKCILRQLVISGAVPIRRGRRITVSRSWGVVLKWVSPAVIERLNLLRVALELRAALYPDREGAGSPPSCGQQRLSAALPAKSWPCGVW